MGRKKVLPKDKSVQFTVCIPREWLDNLDIAEAKREVKDKLLLMAYMNNKNIDLK